MGAYYNRLNSTNPCGEYAFLDDSSCNLASINVFRYYDAATDHFDVEGFEHTVDVVQLALEASIAWGQFPTKDIARKTYRFRATGLGISNLASLLMAKGMPYDSREARAGVGHCGNPHRPQLCGLRHHGSQGRSLRLL